MKVITNGFTKVGNTGVAPSQQLHVDGNVLTENNFLLNNNAATRDIAGINGQYDIRVMNNQSLLSSGAFFIMRGLNQNVAAAIGDFTVGGAKVQFKTGVTTSNTGQTRAELTGTGLNVFGVVQANGVTLTSDKKTKKNITSFNYGLNEVMKLKPSFYNYNGLAGTLEEPLNVGVMAQELQKVAPELVTTRRHLDYDADSGEIFEDAEYLQINDTAIKYMLVNAIQDQQKLIEDQAEKIANLEDAVQTIGSTESTNNSNVTLSSYDLADLGQNTPNPFNGSTSISYVIPTESDNAQINIFGQNGQLMKTLDIEHVGQGQLNVDAQNLPSGTYSYQLMVDGRSIQTYKMVVAQ